MKLPLSELPPEYHDWVDGLERAWTSIDPSISDALLAKPAARNGPIRLTEDLANEELADSTFLNNALVLLRAAAQGKGMKLTARGNLYPRPALTRQGFRCRQRQRSGLSRPGRVLQDVPSLQSANRSTARRATTGNSRRRRRHERCDRLC